MSALSLRACVPLLEALAPPALAAPWDNVGLLSGDPEQAVRRALVCIDLTEAVLAEALAAGAELVVAYHPPLFAAVRRLPWALPAARAQRHGIALYAPHTALDAAVGGTNDVLAEACGLRDSAPLQAALLPQPAKLVAFVPQGHTEAVCAALFAAGAGQQGDYSACSFRSAGRGSFVPGAGARPHIGRAGEAAQVDEDRVEVLVPAAATAAVLRALHSAHPYEAPAYDLLARAAQPAADVGMGRTGTVAAGTRVGDVAARLTAALGLPHLLRAGDAAQPVRRAAVAAGAGGSLLDDAIAAGAELFVSGELRHHEVLRARAAGVACLLTLHSSSERPALASYARRLAAAAPGLDVRLSAADVEPLVVH